MRNALAGHTNSFHTYNREAALAGIAEAGYRTVELTPTPPAGDLVLLASASAARAWAKLGGSGPAVTIGPQTTAAAHAAGLDVVDEAKTQDVSGLVDCAAVWRASSRS